MQVESSTISLLTEGKASSLPSQVCPFHPLSTLELVEKAKGFCYVQMLLTFVLNTLTPMTS